MPGTWNWAVKCCSRGECCSRWCGGCCSCIPALAAAVLFAGVVVVVRSRLVAAGPGPAGNVCLDNRSAWRANIRGRAEVLGRSGMGGRCRCRVWMGFDGDNVGRLAPLTAALEVLVALAAPLLGSGHRKAPHTCPLGCPLLVPLGCHSKLPNGRARVVARLVTRRHLPAVACLVELSNASGHARFPCLCLSAV